MTVGDRHGWLGRCRSAGRHVIDPQVPDAIAFTTTFIITPTNTSTIGIPARPRSRGMSTTRS